MDEAELFKHIAGILGIIYRNHIEPSRILLQDDGLLPGFAHIRHTLVREDEGEAFLYIAPTIDDLVALKRQFAQSPQLAQRLRICTPSMLGRVLRERHSNRLGRNAQWMTPSRYSASRVLNLPQAFAISAGVFFLGHVLLRWPWGTLFVVHIVLTLFFFSAVIIRLAAAMAAKRLPAGAEVSYVASDLPVYSVLVPLYREANIVSQLLDVLQRLSWPSSKLDIKLVCESDDAETLLEIGRHRLPPFIDVVVVPPIGPKTKPKALNFALHSARGEFVTVFDAEDRPHPRQLLVAWQAFMDGGEKLACVQAPLIIGNFRSNFLTRMFAFEYATLFRGLLPWMAQQNLVMPLGGTSNHMRRSCLMVVGGWDAHNVTEDADLGVRFARFGYRIGVTGCGTIEDAPENYTDWRKQRTRWLKGWMQTWLVHMRNPVQIARELGLRRFVVSQIYMTGLIMSALFHPLMLMTIGILAISLICVPSNTDNTALLWLDMVNVLLAYLSYYVLGMKTMEQVELKRYPYLFGIMLYWILISGSAWRALWQLMRAPFLWEKTPHYRTLPYLPVLSDTRKSVPEPMINWSSAPIA